MTENVNFDDLENELVEAVNPDPEKQDEKKIQTSKHGTKNENLILVQGSVPGSKNSVVMLKDAIKSKVPDAAPFPAGLYSLNEKDTPKDVDIIADNKKTDDNPENKGDQVEN